MRCVLDFNLACTRLKCPHSNLDAHGPLEELRFQSHSQVTMLLQEQACSVTYTIPELMVACSCMPYTTPTLQTTAHTNTPWQEALRRDSAIPKAIDSNDNRHSKLAGILNLFLQIRTAVANQLHVLEKMDSTTCKKM